MVDNHSNFLTIQTLTRIEGLLPKSCKKINEKLKIYLITAGYSNQSSKKISSSAILEEKHFISLILTVPARRRLPSPRLWRDFRAALLKDRFPDDFMFQLSVEE